MHSEWRESLTLKIVDEVLDVAGLRKPKDIQEKLDYIRGMPLRQLYELVDDLTERINAYYRTNLTSIQREMMKVEGELRAYYYGSPVPLGHKLNLPADWFLRMASLYYDKIILEDPIGEMLVGQRKQLEEESTREWLAAYLSYFSAHKTWMKHGVVEIIPSPMDTDGIRCVIDEITVEDCEDETRNSDSPYFDYEEFDTDRETIIQGYERYVDHHLRERIKSPRELRMCALRSVVNAASWCMGGAVFGSLLMNSHPVADTKRDWRILSYWIMKRARELVGHGILTSERLKEMRGRVEAGMPWLCSEFEGLGFIRNLCVENALKIREYWDFSFRTFREELGRAVDRIQKSKEESGAEFGYVMEQELAEARKVAEDVKADLDNLRSRLGVGRVPSGLSMVLGLMPLSLSNLAQALLVDGVELGSQESFLERRKSERLSAYWLIGLAEDVPDYRAAEILGKREAPRLVLKTIRQTSQSYLNPSIRHVNTR